MPVTNLLEYVPRVYRFALRLSGDYHAAEDLTQETFLRAWQHVGRLRDTEAARTWLFRIAANLWRDQVRRGRHPVSQAGPLVDNLRSGHPAPDKQLVDREDTRRAVAAMDTLPPRQREVLYLHVCEGLSYDEIASVLEISSDSVKASLSLARRKMRELLQDVVREISSD